MKYSKVFIDSFGYELAPDVVTTEEIENRLQPFFDAVGFRKGQIESLTGIKERRYWEHDHTLAEGAVKAGRKAIDASGVSPEEIEALVFCGVCRDGFEPATSCAVADGLNISRNSQVYDVSNACLGVVTGIVQVANAIELGQIRAGLVVSCETARQIVDSTIEEINQHKSVEFYKDAVATMTGGSGAVAVLLTDGSFHNSGSPGHAITCGRIKNSIQHHDLCHWGFTEKGMPTDSKIIMRTKAQQVLENGVGLAVETFRDFLNEFDLKREDVDKFIAHQVGALHHQSFYSALDIDMKKDFATYPYLGNVGTVSLPISAAIAEERGFLEKGDFVVFIGVGSGLNCLILGIEW
ncbi:MAG: 3-oxoacyl-ACP synthase III [Desulfobacteraceae bacterium]